MKKLLPTIFLPLFCFANLASQNTVGLLSYDPSRAFDGYNLVYPHNQPHVYLLDNCGEIAHVWEDSAQYRPGNIAYLLFNGNLLRGKRLANVANDPIWAGGGGAIVEIVTWDNELLWRFEMNDETNRLHHDFSVTDDGNILMLAWEKKTAAEAIQAGRDTALLPDGELWSEWLLEVNPATDEIEWEWHLWDHLVQDFDPTKDNYGVVSEHPERMDLNFTTNNGGKDWLHINALDMVFNPGQIQDQVMLCSPFISEFWVIDHTTTTAEAASHTGGLSSAGGDLMYRWGNPQVWDGPGEQTLFFPHDAHHILDFLAPTHPHYGKFAVFNNQVGPDYSTFNVLTPPWEMYEGKYLFESGTWGPENFDLVLTHPDGPQAVYSDGLSSLQALPNGNFLICSGRQGYSFEMTEDNEIVWEYVTPLLMGQPVEQGTVLQPNNNLTFRMKRYPADFQGFSDKDLSSKGWIELSPDSSFCDELLPVVETGPQYDLQVSPNPANDELVVEWAGAPVVDVEIFDVMGRLVFFENQLAGGRKTIDISALRGGVYFLRLNQEETRKVVVE